MRKIVQIFSVAMMMYITLNATEMHPSEEEVARLYVATFDRAPDSAGLSYWVNDSGLTLSEIAESFFDQQETRRRYPENTSTEDFVKAVYRHLFNREPDRAGLAYWVNELEEGRYSRSLFIQTVVNGAQGEDARILANKTEVGLLFAGEGMSDTAQAEAVMEGVDAASQSVAYIEGKIRDHLLEGALWQCYGTPVFTDMPEVTVEEHKKEVVTVKAESQNGTVRYGLSGEDSSSFIIDRDTGRIRLKTAADYEVQQMYDVDVWAEDSAGCRETRHIAVHVVNIAEVPVLEIFTKTIYEGNREGAEVGKVRVVDPGDTPVLSFRLNRTSLFRIDNNGVIYAKETFDIERDKMYVLKVYASNSVGESDPKDVIIRVKKRKISSAFRQHEIEKSIEYDIYGRVVKESFSNGTAVTYMYDESGNLVSQQIER